MNQWMLLRRLRGPAFLLLVGVTALLNQWDVLSFGRSWPLYLILAGLLSLAERAALAQANLDGYDPATGQARPMEGPGYYPPGGASSSVVPVAPSTAPGHEPGPGSL